MIDGNEGEPAESPSHALETGAPRGRRSGWRGRPSPSRARWYRPSWGGFSSRDSVSGVLATPVTLNQFTYANDDPLSYIDPDGHFAMRMEVDGRLAGPQRRFNYLADKRFAGERRDMAYWDSPVRVADRNHRKQLDAYVLKQRHLNPNYNPSQDKQLVLLANTVVMQNIKLFDIAKDHKNPDQNIGKADFEAVVANASGQYSQMQQWAASLLLSMDGDVSKDQRAAAMKGGAEELSASGWKLWSWKEKQPAWKRALAVTVGALAGVVCAVGLAVVTEGAGTPALGVAASTCSGATTRYMESQLNGEGFTDSLADALNPKAMVIDMAVGGITGAAFELGGTAVQAGKNFMVNRTVASLGPAIEPELGSLATGAEPAALRAGPRPIGEIGPAGNPGAIPGVGGADHHIFPQQFRAAFEGAGINIDDYTVTLDQTTHLRGVHGGGLPNSGMPGGWNRQWAQFLDTNPGASAQEVYQQAGRMMDDFGLSGRPIHPYRK